MHVLEKQGESCTMIDRVRQILYILCNTTLMITFRAIWKLIRQSSLAIPPPQQLRPYNFVMPQMLKFPFFCLLSKQFILKLKFYINMPKACYNITNTSTINTSNDFLPPTKNFSSWVAITTGPRTSDI